MPLCQTNPQAPNDAIVAANDRTLGQPMKTKVLSSLTAIALAGTSAVWADSPAPIARAKPNAGHQIVFPNRGTDLLYGQTDNDNGNGIVTQNFESEFDVYDSEGADDFKVPAGKIWKITEVYVDGTYFNGTGSAHSFNVAFYSIKKGRVDKLVRSCPNASYYFDTQFDFGSEYIQCKAKLRKGHYIVAIQATLDFAVEGEWGWLTNNTVRTKPSLWRNPGGGFGVGCADFAPTKTCISGTEGGDYSFALYGSAKNVEAMAAD